jgi:hypothetical protein
MKVEKELREVFDLSLSIDQQSIVLHMVYGYNSLTRDSEGEPPVKDVVPYMGIPFIHIIHVIVYLPTSDPSPVSDRIRLQENAGNWPYQFNRRLDGPDGAKCNIRGLKSNNYNHTSSYTKNPALIRIASILLNDLLCLLALLLVAQTTLELSYLLCKLFVRLTIGKRKRAIASRSRTFLRSRTPSEHALNCFSRKRMFADLSGQ